MPDEQTAVQQTTATLVQSTEIPVTTDIQKLDAQIAQMEQDGKELFADAIQTLKDKRAALVTEAETEAKAAETKVETAEKTFWEKYGNEILNSVEIVALAAIIYRLFIF